MSRIPKVRLTVTTYEFDGSEWIAVVTHTFHADTEDDAYAILEAHKKTDAFFAGSFAGKFNGINLANSKIEISTS